MKVVSALADVTKTSAEFELFIEGGEWTSRGVVAGCHRDMDGVTMENR